MTSMLMTSDSRSKTPLAQMCRRRYGSRVAVNPVTGLGRPIRHWRTGAPISIAGAFFASAFPVHGGCAWDTFGYAGFLCPRSANPRTAATLIRLAVNGDSSPDKGAVQMKHALIPSAIRAFAHRRMALIALRANSSLSVRLTRYNAHMTIVRTLKAQGGAA